MKSQTGFSILAILAALLVLSAALTILAFIFGVQVPPGFVGVRQILVGPDQGYQPDALKPGFYGVIPIRSRVHLLDSKIQILAVTKGGYTTLGSSTGLDVTTADGNYVSVTSSVVFSLFQDHVDGVHGGPADLIARLGLSEASWKNQIISITSDKMIRALSALSASQFYDPAKRNEKLLAAEKEAQTALSPFGVQVERILLDHYEYVDKRIDDAIFRKNIQSQEEKLNEQKSNLADAGAKLEKASAEADANIESLRVEGMNRSLVLRSEADLYEKSKQAEGDLAYAKAQAEVDRLKATVLQKAGVSDLYVARQMAPLVSSLKGGVINQIDPYDVEAWAAKLGAGR